MTEEPRTGQANKLASIARPRHRSRHRPPRLGGRRIAGLRTGSAAAFLGEPVGAAGGRSPGRTPSGRADAPRTQRRAATSASPMRGRRPAPSSSISNTWARRWATCSTRAWCSSRWRPRSPPSASTRPASTRLRAVLHAEEQWKPGLPAPRDEFHIALAEQSKNPVLQLFINVLMRLTTRYALASRTDSANRGHRGGRPSARAPLRNRRRRHGR